MIDKTIKFFMAGSVIKFVEMIVVYVQVCQDASKLISLTSLPTDFWKSIADFCINMIVFSLIIAFFWKYGPIAIWGKRHLNKNKK